jgi:dihydroflavonol-4-reductase
MKIIIVGGTGLLGSAAARLMIQHGHDVEAISLPSISKDLDLPKEMVIHFYDYMVMDNREIEMIFKGKDAFVFAAGVDERVEFTPPVYEAYDTYNIKPVERMLTIAKKVGIKHAVILGSYFSYFAKKWRHLKLEKYHPYIRSRLKQEQVALSFADEKFFVNVLELPYIFGIQNGRKPVWTIFVKQFEKPKIIFFTKGGTAMVTVNQVAHAIYHAILYGEMKKCYPIGYFNMEWKPFIKNVLTAMNMPNKRIVIVPNLVALYGFIRLKKDYNKKGIEPGLHPVQFLKLMSRKTFISRDESMILNTPDDDINQAIYDSIFYAYKIEKENLDVLEMKVKL